MEFNAIITRHRDLYVDGLLEFYKRYNTGAKEILIEINSNESIKEFKLYRLDHFEMINGESKPTEFNTTQYLDFETIEYGNGDFRIELNPFYWNGCEFILSPKPSNIDWLIDWINKWIDREDTNPEDANGLSRVIHSVTRPEETEEHIQFSTDFGSADIEPFLDLINELYIQQVKLVKIGSFSMIEK